MNTQLNNVPQHSVATLCATVTGRVQGVGFRFFVLHEAQRLGLGGTVQNRPDGSVYVVAHGSRPDLERLLSALRRGPLGARVDRVSAEWSEGAAGETHPARFEVVS